MNNWTARIKAHALSNYETGGWDYIVESFEDSEIATEIEGCKTYKEALKKMKRLATVLDDRRKDIQATAW